MIGAVGGNLFKAFKTKTFAAPNVGDYVYHSQYYSLKPRKNQLFYVLNRQKNAHFSEKNYFVGQKRKEREICCIIFIIMIK